MMSSQMSMRTSLQVDTCPSTNRGVLVIMHHASGFPASEFFVREDRVVLGFSETQQDPRDTCAFGIRHADDVGGWLFCFER